MVWEAKRTKPCQECGVDFLPVTSNNKFCPNCSLGARHAYQRRYYALHREYRKAKSREYRAKQPKLGYRPKDCVVCHATFKPDSANQKYCKTCKPLVMRKWFAEHSAQWRARYPEKVQEVQRRSKMRHREEYLAMQPIHSARHSDKARREVFGHYSNGKFVCACCGETEIDFLTIDHVNNDGARQRRDLFGRRDFGGTRFYRWLIKNGFPSDLAVLCMNCNLSKAKHGVCVHQTKRFFVETGSCLQ